MKQIKHVRKANISCSFFSKIMIVFLFFIFINFSVSHVLANEATIPSTTGGVVTHRGTKDPVYINSEYDLTDTEFRACWVSPLVGDISAYEAEATYKKEILDILTNMEKYHLNVMVFHIRIMNDALYESNYNNWSIYYNTDPNWEALPWIIEECHKRGIEFHAWMNPYRVQNGTHDLENLAKNYPASNVASNPNNMLQGTNSVILNPGIPEVKTWLVKVCMEVVNKYDVDAIHFDDYFYDAGVDDSNTRKLYNIDNLSLGDFRRKQVDDFIENLSKSIRQYNNETGKRVQLGISPSGVYRSGDGKVTYDSNGNAITNGSNTGTTFIHYDNYLYSDTLKWINEEWIDYIMPQCYWAIEHSLCPFADLLSWWNAVVKYKKVRVYAGIGLYQQDSSNASSWYTSKLEAYYQMMICNTLERVDGLCFFAYKNYRNAVNNPSRIEGIPEVWTVERILPEILYGDKIDPGQITNLQITSNEAGYKLSFDKNDLAKFYVIYRSEGELTYSPNEVVDVIGNLEGKNGNIEFTDIIEKGNYNYAVCAQSNSLTLGSKSTISTTNATSGDKSYLGNLNVVYSNDLSPGRNVMISFEKLTYPLGGTVSSKLTYSFDDKNETIITSFTTNNGFNYVNILVPNDAKEFKVRIESENKVARSVFEDVKIVKEGLDTITSFTIIGDYYTNEVVTFVWNKYLGEGYEYIIYGSSDGFNYQEIKRTSSEIDILNYRIKGKLLTSVGKQYYKVVASKDGLFGYSEIIEIDVKDDLGGLKNFLIGGKEVQDTYYGEEYDKFTLTWDKKISGSEVSIETVYYSVDLKNWFKINLYSDVTSSVANNKVKYEIELSDSYSKVYFKVSSTLDDQKFETDPIEVYVKRYFVFYDEVSGFIANEQDTFVYEMDIFK